MQLIAVYEKDAAVQRAVVEYLDIIGIKTPRQYTTLADRFFKPLSKVIKDARTAASELAPPPPDVRVFQPHTVVGYMRTYARYAFGLVLNAKERIDSRASWGLVSEHDIAYALELGIWERWLRPGMPISVLVQWERSYRWHEVMIRDARTDRECVPKHARDPLVKDNNNQNSAVVMQAHILRYQRRAPTDPRVTVLIDADQYPWLNRKHSLSVTKRTLHFDVAPRDFCNVDYRSNSSCVLSWSGCIRIPACRRPYRTMDDPQSARGGDVQSGTGRRRSC
jgi:hypothetical protein